MGWSLAWRVGVVDAIASGLLQGGLWAIRGGEALDLVDRAVLFMVNGVVGLLVCDWAARLAARRRYQLEITHFIGIAVAWRQAIGTLVAGVMLGVVSGAIVGAIRLWKADSVSESLNAAGFGVTVFIGLILAVASTGWAAHRVFAREQLANRMLPAEAPPLPQGLPEI